MNQSLDGDTLHVEVTRPGELLSCDVYRWSAEESRWMNAALHPNPLRFKVCYNGTTIVDSGLLQMFIYSDRFSI